MLDPRHFARRGFAAGTLSVSVQFFAAFGFLFLALPYLQLVMGYSPLQAAGALVPMALVVIPLSRVAPAIAARFGVRVAGATGLSLMALGFIVLATLEVGSSYAHFLAGLLPFGAGMALAGAPATTAIVASLPRSKQGVASAVNDVSRELGGALGIAVLGSLMNSVYRAEMADSTGALPAGAGEKARGSLAAAQQIGEQLGPQGHQLVLHAQAAFLHGFTRGLVGGAALLLLGALFVAVRAPGRAESRSNATGKPIGAVAAEAPAAEPTALGVEHEGGLDTLVLERLGEAVERDAQADELRQRLGPALARPVERLDRGEPVDAVRVDAAEDDAVLEDRVDAEDAAVELDRLRPRVEPEQAGDAVPAQQPDAVGHHLRVAGRLDDEVEAADLVPERRQEAGRQSRRSGLRRRPTSCARGSFAGPRDAVQTSRPSRRRRYVESMPIAPTPSTSARWSSHGWRPPIERACLIPRSQIDAGSTSTPSGRASAGRRSAAPGPRRAALARIRAGA